MNNLLCSIFILLIITTGPSIWAQVGTGFEEPYGGTANYTDPDYSTTHTLVNIANPAATVAHTSSGGELGFTCTFTPSRTGVPGTTGLSDGDAVGVHDNTTLVASTDLTTWATGQAFIVEDPDGMLSFALDAVDLAGTTNPQFSMDLWVDETSYETGNGSNDRIYIRLEIDGGATVIDVLDSDGGGSGGGSGGDIDTYTYPGSGALIEGELTNITVDLTPYVGQTVQLIIEADFDSGSEKVVFDNIDFTEGSAVSTSLPVELSRFDAERKGNEAVEVVWQTQSEYTNKGFYLERMLDSEQEFEAISFTDGMGTSTTVTNYSYTDENASTSISYYRLRQVDMDGQFSYSDIVAVRAADKMESEMLLFQSGAITDELAFRIINEQEATTVQRASIFGLSGQLLQESNLQGKTGVIRLSITAEWPAGVYLLRLDWGDGHSVMEKFVKQ